MLNQLSYEIWDKEIAWIAVILVSFITSVIMFKRAYVKTDSEIKFNPIFRDYGLFAIGYLLSRIAFVFSDFEKLNHGESATYVLFVISGYIVGFFSALSIISLFEMHILQMKRNILSKMFLIFGLALVVGFILILISPTIANTIISPIRIISIVLSGFGFVVVIYLYAKIIFQFAGDLRRNAIFTFIGFILIFAGTVMDSQLFINSLNIPIWLPAIFPIVGMIDLIIVQRTL